MFGLMKKDCIATVVTGCVKNNGVPLKKGTLLKTVRDYHGDGCIFKIRDFRQWLDIYKTTIYKCGKDDIIPLTGELYLYLLATKNVEERIHFVEQVNSHQFDINILKMGCNIRIRSPPDSNVKYFEFVITHKGILKSGPGYYIGLQLKNEYLPLPSHLICLNKHYNFGGTGIVVSVDWILQNLHKETECQQEILNPIPSLLDLSIDEICSSLKIPQSYKPIIQPNEINNIDALPQLYGQPSEIKRVIINSKPMNHIVHIESLNKVNGSGKNVEKTKCDLLDVEIKNLSGDLIYTKVLDNRNDEYEATEPNTNAPRYTLNEMINKNTTQPFVTRSFVDHTGICVKCSKSNIPIRECVTLSNCKHKMCHDCIVPMTKSQSESQYIPCPICPRQSDGVEVSKITGLDSRINEVCFCRPTVSNCGIVLKCKHKFCRTFLIETLKEQLERICQAFCPLCYEEIDDCQKKCLVDQMKLGVVQKCRTCSNRADVLLTKCQHPFCQKCIRDLITNQFFDRSLVSINCTTCYISIADSDIMQYASEELLAQLKSKNETAPMASNPFDHITLNNFQCVLCNRSISIEQGVMLAGCRHYFCLRCFMEFIGRQSNSLIPTCPICPNLE